MTIFPSALNANSENVYRQQIYHKSKTTYEFLLKCHVMAKIVHQMCSELYKEREKDYHRGVLQKIIQWKSKNSHLYGHLSHEDCREDVV